MTAILKRWSDSRLNLSISTIILEGVNKLTTRVWVAAVLPPPDCSSTSYRNKKDLGSYVLTFCVQPTKGSFY